MALAFLLLMGTHLTGAVVALSVDPYADWMSLSRKATVTVTGAVVYAVAQCYVWGVFLRTRALATSAG